MDMIAQLDYDSMMYVVTGTDGRSGGLVACYVDRRNNSYDHKLAVQAPGSAAKQIWDFLVERADGTAIRLHQNFKDIKFSAFPEHPHASPVGLPRRGPGTSDGKGTFKHYRDLGAQETLRFKPFKWSCSIQTSQLREAMAAAASSQWRGATWRAALNCAAAAAIVITHSCSPVLDNKNVSP